MGIVRGVSGKTDSRMIECVQFSKSALTSCAIDGVTEIECGENCQFNESLFSRGSEGETMSIKETEFSPDLSL